VSDVSFSISKAKSFALKALSLILIVIQSKRKKSGLDQMIK
jgi:hypothetical protein